MSVDKVR